MINFGLAREIYGMTPWFVDQESLPVMLGMLNSFRQGTTLEVPEIKYNTPDLLQLDQNHKIVDRPYGDSWNPGQLDNNEDFKAVGIINLNGPITVGGGASSIGVRDLSSVMLRMSDDSRVVGFLISADSGGGASGAVEIMSDTIKEVRKSKPVIGLVKKGGMAASACYGILSACNKIYAESEMSIVGSAGTMIQFEGMAANSQSPDGEKNIRLYATKSTHKNKGFEEALNNDNYDVLVNDLLDPVNEEFLSLLINNRPALKGTDYDNGNTKFAKDSIGTFIDGIQSLEQTVDEILSITSTPKSTKSNKSKTKNSNTMDIQQLRQDHPDLYNKIFSAGVTSERERVGVWMKYSKADPDAVQKGIESGESLGVVQREDLLIKMSSLSHVQNLESDSAPDFTPPESGKTETENSEVESFYADVDKKLK